MRIEIWVDESITKGEFKCQSIIQQQMGSGRIRVSYREVGEPPLPE